MQRPCLLRSPACAQSRPRIAARNGIAIGRLALRILFADALVCRNELELA